MTRPPIVPNDCKVFTPAPLADAMAAVLPNRPTDRWLEPCVGAGAFLSALSNARVGADQITAVELDHHHGLDEQCGNYHSGVDYLGWSLVTPERFDRIIGNPPYLPLHRVPTCVREAALRTPRPGGGYVPPKANCWYAFVCASLRLLNPGGGLCFVLPSGWEYADYAADLRKLLPLRFARFEVVRSAASFFKGVLDGCTVVIADGYGEGPATSGQADLASMEQVITHLATARLPQPAALVDADGERSYEPATPDDRPSVRFGSVAQVRIGAVTGDAAYFLFTDARRAELGLSTDDVRPVLTRARHLSAATVTRADWARLAAAEERVWLFWPPVRPGRPRRAVTEYLADGLAAGCHLRKKVRVRAPWYHTRIPPAPDGFISGMTPHGPWIALNRMQGLTATNTLYTVNYASGMSLPEKAAWALALMSTSTAGQHRVVGRRYSDGLLKFEPKDVMALTVPRPADTGPAAVGVYRYAINALVSGDTEVARAAAEAFVRAGRAPSRVPMSDAIRPTA